MPLLNSNSDLYTGSKLAAPTVEQPTFEVLAMATNPRSFLSTSIAESGVLPDPAANVYNPSGEPFDAKRFSDDYAKAMFGFMGLSERWTTAISANIFGIPNIDSTFRVQRGTLLQTLSNSPVEEFAQLFYNLHLLKDKNDKSQTILSLVGGLASNGATIQKEIVSIFRELESVTDMLAPVVSSMQTATEHLQNIPVLGWIVSAVKVVWGFFKKLKSYATQQAKDAYKGMPWTKRVVYNPVEDTIRAQRMLDSYMQGNLDFFGAFDYDEALISQCEKWMDLPGNPHYTNQFGAVLPPFCDDRSYNEYVANQGEGPILKVKGVPSAFLEGVHETVWQGTAADLDQTLPITRDGKASGQVWSSAAIRETEMGQTYGRRMRLVADREWATPGQEALYGNLRDPLNQKYKDVGWDSNPRWDMSVGYPNKQAFRFRQSYAPGTSTGLTDFELFKDGNFNVVSKALNPAACQLALRLWGETIRMTPTMYCLDAGTEADRWNRLQVSLFLRLQYYGGNSSYEQAAKGLFSKLKNQLRWDNLKLGDDTSKAVDVFENSTPVRALRNLAARQWKCLDLGILPYLSTDMPAIARNPAMKKKLEENRQIFLNHPAVCYADPSAIPHKRGSSFEQFAYASSEDTAFHDVVGWIHEGTQFGHPYNGKCVTAQNPQYALKQPSMDFNPSETLETPITEASVDFSRLPKAPSSGGGAGAAIAVGGAAAAAAFTLLRK